MVTIEKIPSITDTTAGQPSSGDGDGDDDDDRVGNPLPPVRAAAVVVGAMNSAMKSVL
ncbi:hypothetical protein [Streptomyces sp. NBC_01304]|uniref:hypothetical protein n=1 Tax=Streptomyces sp. NBC_01304 TaxID=2903818 RepID=UPI002E13F2DE|nr:hypothetical protein OG430_44075 [Streptomyces sp. NBC_01304]